MSNRSFSALFQKATKKWLLFHSFQKSDQKSDHSFALSKRVTKRAIAFLLLWKEQKSKNKQKMSNFPNHPFFAQKKERLLIFKMSECPTLVTKVYLIFEISIKLQIFFMPIMTYISEKKIFTFTLCRVQMSLCTFANALSTAKNTENRIN